MKSKKARMMMNMMMKTSRLEEISQCLRMSQYIALRVIQVRVCSSLCLRFIWLKSI